MSNSHDEIEGLLGAILLMFVASMLFVIGFFTYDSMTYDWVCADRGTPVKILSVGSGKYPSVTYELSDGRKINTSDRYELNRNYCIRHKKVKK